MDTQLIKQILNIEFYEQNKAKLSRDLFDGDILDLYDVVVEAHGKYGSDLSTAELYELWKNANPVSTKPTLELIKETVDRIEGEDLINPSLATDLVDGLWKRETGRKIAKLGADISQGKLEAYDKLKRLIEKTETGFVPEEFGEDTTTDISELIDVVSDANRWKFNIRALSNAVYGPAPGEFGFVIARTNAGKTGFGVSLGCGPNGWIEQGARVAYLLNEEDPRRTMLRAVMAWTGMTKDEIVANPKGATEAFDIIRPNLLMRGIAGWDMTQVDSYLNHKKPDIVVIDMLDKVLVEGGKDMRDDLRLGEVYQRARDLASYNKHNCVVLGMSQGSDKATGKTIVTPDMAANSTTSKGAEADLILGIGMLPPDGDGNIDPVRYITIGKNKINGVHTTVSCLLEGAVSRFVD